MGSLKTLPNSDLTPPRQTAKSMKPKKSNDRLLLIAFLLSGFVALGYEMVWTRLLGLVLGGELLGVLGVLAGFFLGMVLGAFVLSRHARRAANPIKMFLILECVIAVYGLISPHLIYALSDAVPKLLGPVAGDNDSLIALTLSLFVSSIVLLPATFGMGANFAYLIEAQRRVLPEHSVDKSVGRMYGANTLGAMLGTFGSVYLVVPYLGFQWSALLFCLAGFAAVAAAWKWSKNAGPNLSAIIENESPDESLATNQSKYFCLLFATGLAAIGIEIVVIHLLKQILVNTIFTFANILGIYLVGTAVGAWLYQHSKFRTGQDWQQKLPAQLMLGLLVSIVVSFGVLANANDIMERMSPTDGAYQWHLVAELSLAVFTFFLPTIFLGALFSFLISRISPENLGKAYAINTLGSALAPFLIGLMLIPVVAPFHLLAMICIGYWIILGGGVYTLRWPKKYFVLGGIPLMCLASGLITQPDLIRLPPGAQELERIEGLMGTVVVSERKAKRSDLLGLPDRVLQVNNQFRMGGGAGFLERRMGTLPLLLSNKVDSVLYLGIGSGTTVGVCQNFPVKNISAVEIVPQIEQVLPWFKEHSNSVFEHPGLTYHAADARRFVSASEDHYDVVFADLYHPVRDGAGLLYTREHFQKLKNLLNEDGLLCQWIPVYQFDQNSLKMVLRSFNAAFSHSHVFLAGYNTQTVAIALVGTQKKLTLDYRTLNQKIVSHEKIQSVFENANDLLASYLLNSEDLAAIAGDGPLNTDLHPILLFEAPKGAYLSETQKAQANLRWLLKNRSLQIKSLLQPQPTIPTVNQVQQSWNAAGLFLEAKILEQQKQQTESWNKLFEAYQQQPDFSPARGQLLFGAIQFPQLREKVMSIFNQRDRNRLRLMLLRSGTK